MCYYTSGLLKGQFTQKGKFCHNLFIPNLYDLLSYMEHKLRNLFLWKSMVTKTVWLPTCIQVWNNMRVNADRIVYVTANPLRFEVCVSSTFIFSLPTLYISCTWSQIVMCCIRWLLQNHFERVYFAVMTSWLYIFSRMHIFNNEEIYAICFWLQCWIFVILI